MRKSMYSQNLIRELKANLLNWILRRDGIND